MLNHNPSDEDLQLLNEFKEGNKSSFEKLMHKYYKPLLNFIYRFVNSREIAEDLTQEVFIRVYRHGASFAPRAKFKTWLYTIARNLSLNELRRLKRKMISIDATTEDKEGGQLKRQIADPNSEDPSQKVTQEERTEAVKTAIAGLPENQKTAVILRRYENLSYEEIAQTMKTTVKAVKSLLSRAKENLKTKLANWIPTEYGK